MASIPFNSLLFIIRIRAVFHDSKIIRGFFLVLWLGVVAGAFTQPFCITFVAVEVVRACTPNIVREYCTSSSVIALIYDTLVLFAISARLSSRQLGAVGPWSEKLKAFVGVRGMSQLSQLLVHSGQQYYLYVLQTTFDSHHC